jgi:hypothetical protein
MQRAYTLRANDSRLNRSFWRAKRSRPRSRGPGHRHMPTEALAAPANMAASMAASIEAMGCLVDHEVPVHPDRLNATTQSGQEPSPYVR